MLSSPTLSGEHMEWLSECALLRTVKGGAHLSQNLDVWRRYFAVVSFCLVARKHVSPTDKPHASSADANSKLIDC